MRKRNQRLRTILTTVRQKPTKIIDLGFPVRQTLYNDVHFLEDLGLLKKLEDDRLAWFDYLPLDEIVEGLLGLDLRNHRYRDVTMKIEDVAEIVGKPPDDRELQQAYYRGMQKCVKFWSAILVNSGQMSGSDYEALFPEFNKQQ